MREAMSENVALVLVDNLLDHRNPFGRELIAAIKSQINPVRTIRCSLRLPGFLYITRSSLIMLKKSAATHIRVHLKIINSSYSGEQKFGTLHNN